MDKINIAFDIDGVALKYTERYAEVFKLFGGKYDILHVPEFNFFNAVPESEHKALCLTFGYMMQEELKLHSCFVSILRYMIYERKQCMEFVTSRQDDLSKDAAVISLWKALSYMSVPGQLAQKMYNVTCTGFDRETGAHRSKLPLLKEMGIEFFIDDRRKTVLELSNAGMIVFMPRRPWNTLPENTPNVIQYNDSSEVVKFLREKF